MKLNDMVVKQLIRKVRIRKETKEMCRDKWRWAEAKHPRFMATWR